MECPVCQNIFEQSKINAHVNECLNSITREENPENTVDTSSFSKKRKSGDEWGCLQQSTTNGPKRTKTLQKSELNLPKKSDFFDQRPSRRNNSRGATSKSPDKGNIKLNHSDVENIVLSDTDNEENADIGNSPNSSKVSNTCSNSHFTYRLNKTSTNYRVTKNIESSSVMDEQKEETKLKNKMPDVFETTDSSSKKATMLNSMSNRPLAEQMRPLTFENYFGQSKALGEKSMLRKLLQSDHIPSLILWGPPGCGKTTLARIIATNCKSSGKFTYRQISAATSGINDVKEVIKIAKNDQRMFKKHTILFLDEIHRFNKTQQDSLLPHVEDGTITLIGATTENPSFQVNNALLSRCRVIVLDKLEPSDLETIIKRAAKHLHIQIVQDRTEIDKSPGTFIEEEAISTLATFCDGDARAALNGLNMAIHSCLGDDTSHSENEDCVLITKEDIKESLQRSHVMYDRAGEEHYNMASALQKSIRGSDDNAALYWLARMLQGGEDPMYIARRLVRTACEDIGLADPTALHQAVSAFQGCHLIGMPECDVILAQCVVYLSRAAKSVEVYLAYDRAKRNIQQHQGSLPAVPLHLRNAPTKLMKSLGYGKGYKHNPEGKNQEYLPRELKGINFFTP